VKRSSQYAGVYRHTTKGSTNPIGRSGSFEYLRKPEPDLFDSDSEDELFASKHMAKV